jgi:hypothetical protein
MQSTRDIEPSYTNPEAGLEHCLEEWRRHMHHLKVLAGPYGSEPLLMLALGRLNAQYGEELKMKKSILISVA